MSNDLNIELDSVYGLGRVSLYFPIEEAHTIALPQIHFLFYRDTGPRREDIITGICLEFGLTYSNPDAKKAFFGLQQMCVDYLESNIAKEKSKEKIIDSFLCLVQDRKMEDLWELYRMTNFRTALRGAPTVDMLKTSRIAQLETENDQLKAENSLLKECIQSASTQPIPSSTSPAGQQKRIVAADLSLTRAA